MKVSAAVAAFASSALLVAHPSRHPRSLESLIGPAGNDMLIDDSRAPQGTTKAVSGAVAEGGPLKRGSAGWHGVISVSDRRG